MLSKPLAEFHDGIGARERACAGHTSGDAHASRLVISDSGKPTGNESSDKWTRKDDALLMVDFDERTAMLER